MYDVGQGDNIKTSAGEVFQIKLKDTVSDTIYPCEFNAFDPHEKPIQHPLGAFDRDVWTDYNSYAKEPYESTTQHTNAGEMSDLWLFTIPCIILVLLLVYILFLRK